MKIGSVPYLNAKPLVWGLDPDQVIYEVPSKLATMLKAGEFACAMVSSVACFQNPGLKIAPGMSVSCIGPAESVKLFHNGELNSIRTVALDTSSLTSVLLAKVILKERHGLSPEFIDMPPSLDEMLAECDGAVTIGDTTMQAPQGKWAELDLGSEWHELTGLPFVFAVWAVNPRLAKPELVDTLLKSKAQGLRSLGEISESEAKRLSLPYQTCYHYLSETMNYDLTDRHLEALNLFRAKARELGFISGDHKLELCDV
jgi:chorismate dehydratase